MVCLVFYFKSIEFVLLFKAKIIDFWILILNYIL